MAAEEDKKFHAVLGGFLINDLRGRADHIHCPEPGVLAAYHERSLLPEEMNSWKEHIVGCARCQAILSELEATDSIPLQVSEKDELLPTAAAMPAANASQAGETATARVPEKSRVTPISRGVRWQWLAPAGALAAGLLVWVAWHENRLPQVKTPAEVATARMEPPATPPASVTQEDRQFVSADEAARVFKDQVSIVGAAPAKPAPQAKSRKKFEKSNSRGRVTHSEFLADKEAGARRDTVRSDLVAATPAQNQPALDNKAGVAGAVSETVEVQTQTARAPVQNEQTPQAAQNQMNAQKLPGPSPLGQTAQTEKSKSESGAHAYRALTPPAKPAPAPPAAAFDTSVSSYLIAGAPDLNLIVAPNKKTFWHVGRSGLIAFSGDGGASWLRQTSNVSVDLTAGSAPSDKVCWIVGHAGTILLTTDAGSHWTILHSPLEEDLGGVRATDALHATIWNAGNSKTFETSDGGVTWKPAAAQ